MGDDESFDIEPGDFLYQSDQELFLVVMEEREDSYLFSVHGWREIGKERLSEYVKGEHGKLHKQSDVDEIIENEADDETTDNYRRLHELFLKYSENTDESGPHTDFALEDV